MFCRGRCKPKGLGNHIAEVFQKGKVWKSLQVWKSSCNLQSPRCSCSFLKSMEPKPCRCPVAFPCPSAFAPRPKASFKPLHDRSPIPAVCDIILIGSISKRVVWNTWKLYDKSRAAVLAGSTSALPNNPGLSQPKQGSDVWGLSKNHGF